MGEWEDTARYPNLSIHLDSIETAPDNRTIVHGSLPAGADVLYTKDANDDIQRIYILTAQERANLDAVGRR